MNSAAAPAVGERMLACSQRTAPHNYAMDHSSAVQWGGETYAACGAALDSNHFLKGCVRSSGVFVFACCRAAAA